ncbi:hypothetical protein SAICODRAFT_9905 [Saitoella complicata NRRL Y-17804]|uniref:uncharacterized protein n=1 Tax=Saitoella complicata (strain BCRC 22490 / CBS 7301 / JCM 7358 / NBRC 10748 / NRRL Y-17804) TaxID=698492 RepID=UPI00086820D5|nr:uncharacterized protein SAICODRAFT_9905 [Saitoella complicata NRRL Y-17804]ODQ50352.1 hypothetical protein SAICODRAFT_9905 [Saitoella complicata NRRL Y-17804]
MSSIVPPPLPPLPPSHSHNGSLSSTPHPPTPLQPHALHPPTADADRALIEGLQGKSVAELKELQETDGLLDAFWESQSPIAKEHRELEREAWKANEELADRIMSTRTTLDLRRTDTDAKLRDSASLYRTWRQTEEHMYSALSPLSPPSLQQHLNASTTSVSEMSDALAESFLEEGGDLGVFLRTYREGRKTVRLGEVQGERWAEGRVGGF